MDGKRSEGQDGQALILVTIALAVTIMLVALAIEVGHLYGERRRMQNAADAGALAGARYRCFGGANGAFGDAAIAEQVARDYAASNYQAGVTPDIATAWLDGAKFKLEVVAGEEVPSFLGTVLGPGVSTVRASAVAACGEATSACGLWPVAFDQDRWDLLHAVGCGTDFFLWTGDNPHNPDPPDCDIYWCDCFPDNNGDGKCDTADGDGIEDIVGQEGRAYVDFSGAISAEYPDPCDQPGCGAAELACWILHDTGARIRIGSCIPDLSGVKAGVKDEVDAREGDAINVPLYDGMGCTADYGSDCTNGRTFHVSGFGCIEPVRYLKNFELPRRDGGNPSYKDNMIRVRINCSTECETNCGNTSGDPPDPNGVRAVSLIR